MPTHLEWRTETARDMSLILRITFYLYSNEDKWLYDLEIQLALGGPRRRATVRWNRGSRLCTHHRSGSRLGYTHSIHTGRPVVLWRRWKHQQVIRFSYVYNIVYIHPAKLNFIENIINGLIKGKWCLWRVASLKPLRLKRMRINMASVVGYGWGGAQTYGWNECYI